MKSKIRQSKRLKSGKYKTVIERNQWFSASSFKNYVMRDTLVDYLDLKKRGFKEIDNDSIKKNSSKYYLVPDFNNYLLQKGIEFEQKVINLITEIFDKLTEIEVSNTEKNDELLTQKSNEENSIDDDKKSNEENSIDESNDEQMPQNTSNIPVIVKVANQYWDSYSITKFHETIEHMKKGTPIIYQGVLHNKLNNTFGTPDLIIRSDYINKFILDDPLTDSEEKHGCAFSPHYHYRIIDIKYTTLKLASDGYSLLNTGLMKAYKIQVGVYNDALSMVQKYFAPYGYILGRGYTYSETINKNTTSYYSDNCFDKLGVIDFISRDNFYKEEIEGGINWITRLRTEGDNWEILPKPSVEELYPNMNIDGNYNDEKKYYAEQLHEITNVWSCGINNRINAFKNNVYSWMDKNCTSKIMGINGPKIAPIVDEMLKFNRGEIHPNRLIMPVKITNNYADWQRNDNLDFYCDFETISDIVDNFNELPIKGKTNYIYFIGIYWHYGGEKFNDKTIRPLKNKNKTTISRNTSFDSLTVMENIISKNKRTTRSSNNVKKSSINNEKEIIPSSGYKYFMMNSLSDEEEVKNLLLWIDFMYKLITYFSADKKVRIFHWGNAEETFFIKAVNKHPALCNFNPQWINILKIIKSEPIIIKGIFSYDLKAISNQLYKFGLISTTYEDTPITGLNSMLYANNIYKDMANGEITDETKQKINEIITYNRKDCYSMYEICELFRANC